MGTNVVDGDDYTFDGYNVRTIDQTILAEIADLRAEIVTLSTAFTQLIAMLDVRPNGKLPGGQSAVLITRRDQTIESRHVSVYHQVVHDAASALSMLKLRDWVFVLPTDASVVLDVLGVQA